MGERPASHEASVARVGDNLQRVPLLYVEDDEAVARAVSRVLSRDVEVVHARTVDEAKAVLASAPGPWCCVADLHLGAGAPLGGLEVLRAARDLDPLAPLAVLTGHDEDASRVAAADLSAVYIVKGAPGAPAGRAGAGKGAGKGAEAGAEVPSRLADGLGHFAQAAARFMRARPASRPLPPSTGGPATRS